MKFNFIPVLGISILILGTFNTQGCNSTSVRETEQVNSETNIQVVKTKSYETGREEQETRWQEKQSRIRDLNFYDKAGPYDLNFLPTKDAALRAEIRDFLWKHWVDQKLGYLVATFYNREGEPSTSSFYVEPDGTGVWHILVDVKRISYDRVRPRENPPRADALDYTVYTVERVKVTTEGYEKISSNETLPSDEYMLLLIDENKRVRKEI